MPSTATLATIVNIFTFTFTFTFTFISTCAITYHPSLSTLTVALTVALTISQPLCLTNGPTPCS